MNGTAKEPLELCNVMVARVTELDLDRAQPGVGENSGASDEACFCELYGLSRRGHPGIGKMAVDRNLARRELHFQINGFVKDVKVSLHNLYGFAKSLAAEGRVGQQSAVARVDYVCSQVQPEAPVLRRLGGEVEQCRMLVERYPSSFLVQQIGLDLGPLEQIRGRQASPFQALGYQLDPDG